MAERLKRLGVIYQRSPIYFVTACTACRRPLLASEAVQNVVVRFSEEASHRGAFVGAYVLMPDHLHLFVRLQDERLTLSAWVKALKGAISLSLRHSANQPPFWQKGFFDHVLRSRESYAQKWEYVRGNPVRARLVKAWDAWPYQGELFDLEFSHDPA